jgi:hypothetical protein
VDLTFLFKRFNTVPALRALRSEARDDFQSAPATMTEMWTARERERERAGLKCGPERSSAMSCLKALAPFQVQKTHVVLHNDEI